MGQVSNMEKRNYTKERDDEVIPVAKEVLLALVARKDLVIGSSESITTEQAAVYYRDLAKNVIIPLLIKKDLKVEDINYVFQVMVQPINFIKEMVLTSFEMNRKISDANLYGIKEIQDLRISVLDKKLKEFKK